MNKIIKIDEFNNVSKNEILLTSKNVKSTIKIEDLNSRKIELYKIVQAQLGAAIFIIQIY